MSRKSQAAEVTPTSIGRYEIIGVLGYGAMGAVYQAFDPIIKRPLAIKTIRLDEARRSPQYQEFIRRFYQEARISGTLSHPNIVTLFDIGDENGDPFLAMEFVEGQTIAALLEKGVRFEPERVVTILSQVAAGLDYAHSRGIVHRDIKPSNLILQDEDRVKVTDFGIAKLIDSEITHAGTLLGTPSYMSPEQAMGEKLDGRSDIFSLGVCAFEMLSGQQPFPGNNVTSILYKLVHVDPIEPAGLEMSGLIPNKWREVFRRALAKKREDRYPKASEFVRDLEYCLGSWFAGLGEDDLVSVIPEDALAPGEEVGTSSPPAGHADTLAIPAPSGSLASVKPDDSATVLLRRASGSTPEVTETLAVPASELPRLGGATPATADSSLPAADGSASPVPRSLPQGWILAGAVGLFLVAATVVGWMLWSDEGAPTLRTEGLYDSEALAAPTPLPLPVFGTLRVLSEPEGALVKLDGEDRGQTPLELEEVPFGTHRVQLLLEGYQPQEHEVSVSLDEAVADLRATFARQPPPLGTVRFASVPPGGEVSVDGKSVGQTPLDGVRLRAGSHRVQIALEGHEPWTGSVEVTAGRRASLEAELIPASSRAAGPPPPEPVDTTRVYENERGQVDRLARRESGRSPSYPSDRAPRLESGERVSVTLSFLVTETGEVRDVEITESAGGLIDGVVVSAVRTWRYEPALIRDVPVKVRVRFRQTFLGG
jgi:TonB family protein